MADALSIALSGAQAQTVRLAASAGNTANMRTRGQLPAAGAAPSETDPYRPVQAVQQSRTLPGGAGAGTVAGVRPSVPAFLAEYDPRSPEAGADGVVGAPNVDAAQEIVQQKISLRAYQANLRTVRAADEMQRALLDAMA
ncbi:flagellar basal body rod protein FlgC [Arenibaculum pallidiluteum]|uniref:flagellar basal body rod protein FlgC n=1 Tax=Arenibaculum pallidiluteum TaxID=2812559 RepID=UPI001A975F78|nr:flagellar basal body rod C-terminal domain-containing protein [Arenibaculum pallidiluteum]